MIQELQLPKSLQTGIKATPTILQPSNTLVEDVAKRLTDLANGEFDFLIFDKISVQKIIQDRGFRLERSRLGKQRQSKQLHHLLK